MDWDGMVIWDGLHESICFLIINHLHILLLARHLSLLSFSKTNFWQQTIWANLQWITAHDLSSSKLCQWENFKVQEEERRKIELGFSKKSIDSYGLGPMRWSSFVNYFFLIINHLQIASMHILLLGETLVLYFLYYFCLQTTWADLEWITVHNIEMNAFSIVDLAQDCFCQQFSNKQLLCL